MQAWIGEAGYSCLPASDILHDIFFFHIFLFFSFIFHIFFFPQKLGWTVPAVHLPRELTAT